MNHNPFTPNYGGWWAYQGFIGIIDFIYGINPEGYAVGDHDAIILECDLPGVTNATLETEWCPWPKAKQ